MQIAHITEKSCWNSNHKKTKQEDTMKDSRKKNGQEGIAMIIVVCIMAVLVMMSLALLLASSVMTRSSGRVRQQEQARILAVSLADELEKDLTMTKSQQDNTSDSGSNGIWEFVNTQITSGGWLSGEERSFQLDTSALASLGQTSDLSAQVVLSWEGVADDYTDASLNVTVTSTYQEMSFSVTTIYTANKENEDEDNALYWVRSERR